ncbi:MAG: hypothetical protein IJ640_09970 [Prevotella sp.]|nr:hypothetical protein [Prevotella sp.]
MKSSDNKTLTLKNLNKSNVWDIQENDVFRMLTTACKNAEFKENFNHYVDIFKTAFLIEEVQIDKKEVIKKYEGLNFKVAAVNVNDEKKKWAIKKRPITRITDLTYENIRHITASKLLEVIDRNFGGGWESISQSIKDIIESGFDISTTTLPKERLKKPGGMYEKKVEDGFEVLEIEKGGWVEAIFAKLKPETEKMIIDVNEHKRNEDDDELDNDLLDDDGFDDEYDEEQMLEESYRTTFDTEPEDLSLESAEVEDDYDD